MPAKDESLKNFVAQRKHSDYKSLSPTCWLKDKKGKKQKNVYFWTTREQEN